jgi:hypothetical protein
MLRKSLLLLATTGALLAAADGPNVSADAPKDKGTSSFAAADESLDLAARAVKGNDPILMLAAAKLMATVTVTEKARAKAPDAAASATAPAADADKKKGEVPATLDGMLAFVDAANSPYKDLFTKATADIRAAAAAAPQARNASNGPNYHRDSVLAGHTDVYIIAFNGDEEAQIAVSGDGSTDLDLYVYDENGHLIASDDDNTDECRVSWTPAWTGKFTVKIVNRGNVYNDYLLLTN